MSFDLLRLSATARALGLTIRLLYLSARLINTIRFREEKLGGQEHNVRCGCIDLTLECR
jgi:hypothetical protein